jgi:hypothetical protein
MNVWEACKEERALMGREGSAELGHMPRVRHLGGERYSQHILKPRDIQEKRPLLTLNNPRRYSGPNSPTRPFPRYSSRAHYRVLRRVRCSGQRDDGCGEEEFGAWRGA